MPTTSKKNKGTLSFYDKADMKQFDGELTKIKITIKIL